MDKEQKKLEKISKNLSLNNSGKNFISYLSNINQSLENAKLQIEKNDNQKAKTVIGDVLVSIKSEVKRLESTTSESSTEEINELTKKIKLAQENYAYSLSKYESIKTETIKRRERIKNIETEVQNWKNLGVLK